LVLSLENKHFAAFVGFRFLLLCLSENPY